MSRSRETVDRAVAVLRKPRATDGQKISTTRSTCDGIQKCAEWDAAPDVQAAVKVWNAKADQLEATSAEIGRLRGEIRRLEARRCAVRRDWAAASKQVMSTVTLHCAGSVDRVKAFTLDVQTRDAVGPLPAPEGIHVDPGPAPGTIVATWPRNGAKHGFLVQYASDPNDAATMSVPEARTAPKFVLDGLAAKAIVGVRVAAIDPAAPRGQSPWSAWVMSNAR